MFKALIFLIILLLILVLILTIMVLIFVNIVVMHSCFFYDIKRKKIIKKTYKKDLTGETDNATDQCIKNRPTRGTGDIIISDQKASDSHSSRQGEREYKQGDLYSLQNEWYSGQDVQKERETEDLCIANSEKLNTKEAGSTIDFDKEKKLLEIIKGKANNNYQKVKVINLNMKAQQINYEPLFSEDLEGKLIVCTQNDDTFGVIPGEEIIDSKDCTCGSVGLCFLFNTKIKVGAQYKIIGIKNICILRKRNSSELFLVQKGELEIEEV